jgi:hypothetical protein
MPSAGGTEYGGLNQVAARERPCKTAPRPTPAPLVALWSALAQLVCRERPTDLASTQQPILVLIVKEAA